MLIVVMIERMSTYFTVFSPYNSFFFESVNIFTLQARIDSHNKVLLAQDVDQRSQIFSKAVDMCELYQRRAKMLLLRSAIMKANISVKVRLELTVLHVLTSVFQCVARDQQALGNFNGTN